MTLVRPQEEKNRNNIYLEVHNNTKQNPNNIYLEVHNNTKQNRNNIYLEVHNNTKQNRNNIYLEVHNNTKQNNPVSSFHNTGSYATCVQLRMCQTQFFLPTRKVFRGLTLLPILPKQNKYC
jgi:hypothetical protein